MILLLCREAVGVFYSPSRVGQPSDCFMSYPGHWLGRRRTYPSAEMQSVYSTAPVEWASHQIVLCHTQDTGWGGGELTPPQRCSRCILQPQSSGPAIRLFYVIPRTLVGGKGELTPLLRCSRCILQPQPIGLINKWEQVRWNDCMYRFINSLYTLIESPRSSFQKETYQPLIGCEHSDFEGVWQLQSYKLYERKIEENKIFVLWVRSLWTPTYLCPIKPAWCSG